MVSNLAIGLISAADTYGRYARPRQEALAKAQVQREIQQGQKGEIINRMIDMSPTLKEADEDKLNILRNNLLQLSTTGLQKVLGVQLQTGDMFIEQEGSYGIKPLTTSKPTEGDQKRKAFLNIVSALQHGNKQGQE